MPCPGALLILAALNEGRFDADLNAQQMLPPIPTRIPQQRQRRLVEEYFQFTT